jgi:hypothetical protein
LEDAESGVLCPAFAARWLASTIQDEFQILMDVTLLLENGRQPKTGGNGNAVE